MNEIEIKGKYNVWDTINVNDVWYRWCGDMTGDVHLFTPTHIELHIKKRILTIIGAKPPGEGNIFSHNGINYQVIKERLGSWKYIYDVEIVSGEWKWKDETMEMF